MKYKCGDITHIYMTLLIKNKTFMSVFKNNCLVFSKTKERKNTEVSEQRPSWDWDEGFLWPNANSCVAYWCSLGRLHLNLIWNIWRNFNVPIVSADRLRVIINYCRCMKPVVSCVRRPKIWECSALHFLHKFQCFPKTVEKCVFSLLEHVFASDFGSICVFCTNFLDVLKCQWSWNPVAMQSVYAVYLQRAINVRDVKQSFWLVL